LSDKNDNCAKLKQELNDARKKLHDFLSEERTNRGQAPIIWQMRDAAWISSELSVP